MTRFVRVTLLVLAGMTPPAARAQDEAKPSSADALSASFRKAAKAVLPAVVSVRAIGGFVPLVPFDAPLARRIPLPDAGGSGVVVDAARGLILTNNHVVPDAPRIVVTLPDGRQRTAREVRRDPRSDLALVTIDPKGLNLSAAEWGDSDALDIGDWVLAIGQPFGLSGTVTAGIVSGKGRAVGAGAYEDLLQTDAAVNPGNSGGPMVDLRGRVVGINTAIKSVGGGYEGIGFAVPASRARRVAADLAEFGRVRRAYLGVLRSEPVDPEQSARGAGPPGALIVAVAEGSPSAEAGLRPGDVVLKVGNRPVAGPGALQALVEFAAIGDPLTLTILRQDETREVTVRPAALTDGLVAPVGAAATRQREGAHDDEASHPGRR